MTIFDDVKRIPIDELLQQRYGIAVPEGAEPRIRCPLHHGEHGNFAVFRKTNTWFCFSECHIGGDVTRLVALMEQIRPIEAARLLKESFGNGAPPVHPVPPVDDEPATLEPISWSLELDPKHPSLPRFGVTPELAETFGIGFCRRRRFRDRICFPVEGPDGQRVGYIGRTVVDADPKYLLSRHCPRGRLLYGLHRVQGTQVVLVEGPRDVWALTGLSVPSVAPIGSWLTGHQVELLQRFDRILIAFDGDSAGRQGASRAAEQLSRHAWVRTLSLPDGEDPASLEPEHLDQLLKESGFTR